MRPRSFDEKPVVATSANEPVRAETKANKAPKQPETGTASNSRPGFSLTKQEYDAAADAVNQAAEEKVADLIGDLGTTVNDPAVADLVKQAQDAAANGTPLPPGWQGQLETAVANAQGSGTVDPAFTTTIQDFVNVQNANAMLAGGGWDPNIPCYPSGNCECILMPCLEADDFCMIRPNCCMVGTGGEGCIGVVTCSASDLVDMPYGIGEPQSESSLDYADAVDSGVLIINPAETDAEINFVLDSEPYSVRSGYSRNFTDKDSWQIRFSRGDFDDDARYTIEPGTYVFESTKKGWDLFRRTIKVTIENNGDDAFNYVAGDEEHTLKSGEALEHTSMYPLFVRFDRGDGQDSVKRFVDSESELAVAVDPKLGQLDLFPSDQIASSRSATNETVSLEEPSGRAALFNTLKAKATGSAADGASRSTRLMALMKASSKTTPKPAAVQ